MLILPLPFLSKEDISVTQIGDELVVQSAKVKRNIILPPVLAERKARDAEYEENKLRIKFE